MAQRVGAGSEATVFIFVPQGPFLSTTGAPSSRASFTHILVNQQIGARRVFSAGNATRTAGRPNRLPVLPAASGNTIAENWAEFGRLHSDRRRGRLPGHSRARGVHQGRRSGCRGYRRTCPGHWQVVFDEIAVATIQRAKTRGFNTRSTLDHARQRAKDTQSARQAFGANLRGTQSLPGRGGRRKQNTNGFPGKSRSFAAARADGLSVRFATRQTYSTARSIVWAPLGNENLYFISGARPRRVRSADSSATRSADEPAPENWAVINNNGVQLKGTSLPRPRASSSPDALAGAECFFARSRALRGSAGVARRTLTIRGKTVNMSLRPDVGSQRLSKPSIAVSRHLAASAATHK